MGWAGAEDIGGGMDRDSLALEFYIEDHALLFGLMGKYAEELCGKSGLEALSHGVMLYGRERGLRMAMRARKNGDELDAVSYVIYGEWSDPKGSSHSEVRAYVPDYVYSCLSCGWCDTWKRYGLMEYGRIYCRYIDKSLLRGFSPKLELLIDGSLSEGDEACVFTFKGADFIDEEGFQRAMARKASMAESNIRDFLYHTGHNCSALRRVFMLELGLLAAEEICERALSEFAKLMGPEKAEAVRIEANQDFLSI